MRGIARLGALALIRPLRPRLQRVVAGRVGHSCLHAGAIRCFARPSVTSAVAHLTQDSPVREQPQLVCCEQWRLSSKDAQHATFMLRTLVLLVQETSVELAPKRAILHEERWPAQPARSESNVGDALLPLRTHLSSAGKARGNAAGTSVATVFE